MNATRNGHARIEPMPADLLAPPYDDGAEMRLVSCLLRIEDRGQIAGVGLNPADLYNAVHSTVCAAALGVIEDHGRMDASLLMAALRKTGMVPDPVYFQSLRNTAAHPDFLPEYADLVRGMAIRRRVREGALRLAEHAALWEDDPAALLAEADRTLLALHQDVGPSAGGTVYLPDAIASALEMLLAGPEPGLPTGLVDLDNAIGGFYPGEMTVIGARPGQGKTSLALLFAIHAAQSIRARTRIFSQEMTPRALARRLLLMEARVDGHKARRGLLGEEERVRLKEAGARLSSLKADDGTPLISIAPPAALSARGVVSACRRAKATDGLDLVIVDYLQLLMPEPGQRQGTREQEVSEIARTLKNLTLELNLPLIALAQINRAGSDAPRKEHLKDSGEIEASSDSILLLHAKTDSRERDVNDTLPIAVDLIVDKGRFGPVGTVPLAFEPRFTRFAPISLLDDHLGGF